MGGQTKGQRWGRALFWPIVVVTAVVLGLAVLLTGCEGRLAPRARFSPLALRDYQPVGRPASRIDGYRVEPASRRLLVHVVAAADPQAPGAWMTAAGMDGLAVVALKVAADGTLATGPDPGGAIVQCSSGCVVIGGMNGLQPVALKVGSDGTVASSGGTSAFGPNFSVGGGTAQFQTVSPATPITNATLVAGYELCWLPVASNTGAIPTLAGAGTSTFSATFIVKNGVPTNLIANDITLGTVACVKYDGMYFQLQNPQAGLVASASLTLGGGASAVGSGATGGYGCGEATSTGFTPTVGQLYKRCDNTLKTFVSSLDGAAETPDPTFDAVPVGGKCLQSLGVAGHVVEALLACGGSTVALSSLTAAAASNAIANGNNPQTWNFAQTTDSQNGITFGETSAATAGTLTSGLANQAEHSISTATNSTATPLNITQGSITNTVATPAMQVRSTWNNAGLNAVGFAYNVTDTLSGASSYLFDFKYNGTDYFWLRKDGQLRGISPAGGDFTYGSNGNLILTSASGNKYVVSNIGFSYASHKTVGSSATPAFDLSTGNVQVNTLTGNVTSSTITSTRDSLSAFFELCQDGTGGRTFVWPTTMKDPPLVHQDASVCKTYPFLYDGTSYFYTGGESSVSNVVPVTVNANVATDQLLQAIPIPPNSLNIAGHVLDIWTAGVYTTTAANLSTVTVKAKLCTVSGCGSGTVITLATFTSTGNAGGQTNDPFSMQLFSTTQTGGASSVFEAHGNLTVDLTAAVASQVFGDANTAVTSAIDTTGPLFLQITAAFSAASGSNSFTGRQLRARLN